MHKHMKSLVVLAISALWLLTGCAYKHEFRTPPQEPIYNESGGAQFVIRKKSSLDDIFALNFDGPSGVISTLGSMAVLYWLYKGNLEKAEAAQCVSEKGTAC